MAAHVEIAMMVKKKEPLATSCIICCNATTFFYTYATQAYLCRSQDHAIYPSIARNLQMQNDAKFFFTSKDFHNF